MRNLSALCFLLLCLLLSCYRAPQVVTNPIPVFVPIDGKVQ